MKITNQRIYREALAVIQSLYGPDAQFRDGQYEAIEATLLNRRTLVVQRTGWGKSLVYFACTKLLRTQGAGVTVVVSPLLVLMQNQIEAAQKLNLRCEALNSQTKDRRKEILQEILDGSIDLVLVTPETLFRDDIQAKLPKMKISLFVIDEAHCISDWGHDFRLEYCRLREVIHRLPRHVPVLATTATANDRVVADLQTQLGNDVFISRGPLTRDSLAIQVLRMSSKAERYGWILQNMNKLPGSGIIYCLTQRDCDYLTDFLVKNGISAMSYYSRSGDGEEKNNIAEKALKHNRIKVLVATIKLGMGYDKGDISFVIHFQMPANIVSYYQQIGRAGRELERAYVFLMSGREDEDILNYFIQTAFPTKEETLEILSRIRDSEGLSRSDLESVMNIRRKRIEKALTFLLNDGFLYREGTKYYLSPKPFVYDEVHYKAIRDIRRREIEQMKELIYTQECYSKFIVQALDDKTAVNCGHCSNCLGHALLPEEVSLEMKERASAYLNGMILSIEPRKMWAASDVTSRDWIGYINQTGFCLSRYGDPGYGELVSRDKYSANHRFCDELVGRSAQLLRPFLQEKGIKYITCVPSLRSRIVPDFAERLAAMCKIQFVQLLRKAPAGQQKRMENSSHQCANAFRSFSLLDGVVVPEKVLLVDDIVDSRWTLTVCGYRLMEHGCREVYPFALADSSQKDG
jgi:ATP-dependent DNA helicase RecQ